MTDIMKLMQQAQEMQEQLQQAQSGLEHQVVTGSSGGGMVTVETDGKGNVRRIKLDPSVVDPKDVEMLEDLIVVAVADAQKKASAAQEAEMGRITGGLNLPFQLPF